MAKEKEACPKCKGQKFSEATDSEKRYCAKCGHVWVPGFDGLTRTDLLLKQAQEENLKLKQEIGKLRAKLKMHEEAAEVTQEIFE